jgi:hypothetical protein
VRGSPQTTGQASCPELGLQRVSWVRIVLGPNGPSCEVAGLGHRRPVRRAVPLRTATALLRAGVPGVVRSVGPGAGGSEPRQAADGPLAGDRR